MRAKPLQHIATATHRVRARPLAGRGSWPCRLHLARSRRCLETAAAAATAAETPHAASSTDQSELQHVLLQLRQSLGIDAMRGKEAIATGKGKHLGINIAWRMRWRADGAFFEEVRSKELGFQWGYDGGANSSCWEMDSSGVSRSIECDDHEALLVGSWIRTSAWLQPHLQDRFHIELEQEVQEVTQATGAPAVHKATSKTARKWAAAANSSRPAAQASTAAAPLPGSTSIGSSGGNVGVATLDSSQNSARIGSGGQATTSGRPSEVAPGPQRLGRKGQPMTLVLRLKGGKLVNRVRVCPDTWTVLELQQPMCGVTETWLMTSWRTWEAAKAQYPSELQHLAVGGGNHVYKTVSCQFTAVSPVSSFQLPVTPLLPIDAAYDPDASPEVPIWRASSGHFLIKPEINGIKGNYYWLLDTGASGFVISPKAALTLGLEAFGELFAASIAGKVPARFIKAASWSLGPLTIRDPVMMTMDLEGLVKGGPGEVLGIVGFDLFRRAVVELPQLNGPDASGTASVISSNEAAGEAAAATPATTASTRPRPVGFIGSGRRPSQQSKSAPRTMLLYNPDTFPQQKMASGADWVWQPVTMIASLPHVQVRFADVSGKEHSVLLMLDTGACGADVMLHGRCIKELQLDLGFEQAGRSSAHHIRGVGGNSGDSLRVDMVEVPWMDMAGVRFSQVKVMRATGGGLDISMYSSGIICGDLVARIPMVIDYSRKRIGFKPRQQTLGA